ncbi:MAG: hypothetical protein ACYTGL_08225 [Planctomycetota bacterium]
MADSRIQATENGSESRHDLGLTVEFQEIPVNATSPHAHCHNSSRRLSELVRAFACSGIRCVL